MNNLYQINYNRVLGKGSSGIVYKGYNIQTREEVAIKCVDINKLKDPYGLYFLIISLKINQSRD